MKKPILLIAAILQCTFAFSQLQTTIHKTFSLDSATTVQLNIHGDYIVETWAGDNILTETKIKLYNASKSILNFFLERGRYDIEGKLDGYILSLNSKDNKRLPIQNKDVTSHEIVTLRIFMPDTFTDSGGTIWTKSQ